MATKTPPVVEPHLTQGAPGYNYQLGPPVTNVGNGGVAPAVTTGSVQAGTSGAAAGQTGTTVAVPGGAPSLESGSDTATQSTVVSIAPTSATQAGGNLALTVTGTKFVDGATTVIVAGFLMPTTYVSPTSVTAVVDRTIFIAGAKATGVQTGAYKSNTTPLTLT